MRYKIGQHVEIQGIKGIIRRQRESVQADQVRKNPAFDPNYESEQGRYNGPLWHPLDHSDSPSDKADNPDRNNNNEK